MLMGEEFPKKHIVQELGKDAALAEIEDFKAEIVEELRKAKVAFPVKTREQLMTIFPKGVYMKCMLKGQKIEIHDAISKMPKTEFPIGTAADVADKLASFCTL
jgi:hypothetical protein